MYFKDQVSCFISPLMRLVLTMWVWYRCQNRIEKYYHHDGEQLTFYQKVLHIKTHRLREECRCNLWIAINSNLLDKNRTQDKVKCHIQHERTWHWTGKLQVTLPFAYIFWNKFCSHAFKASSEEVNVMCYLKMKAKYMKKVFLKSSFRNL